MSAGLSWLERRECRCGDLLADHQHYRGRGTDLAECASCPCSAFRWGSVYRTANRVARTITGAALRFPPTRELTLRIADAAYRRTKDRPA